MKRHFKFYLHWDGETEMSYGIIITCNLLHTLVMAIAIHCIQELYANLFFRCISFTFKRRFMKFRI